jgi:hypothetical protein
MYRQQVFETVGLFDESLNSAEDYDMYFRVARQLRMSCHDDEVAEYRRHAASMSRNTGRMLVSVLRVLRRQWPYVRGNRRYVAAYRSGIRSWYVHYSKQFAHDLTAHLRHGNYRGALRAALGPFTHLASCVAVMRESSGVTLAKHPAS